MSEFERIELKIQMCDRNSNNLTSRKRPYICHRAKYWCKRWLYWKRRQDILRGWEK